MNQLWQRTGDRSPADPAECAEGGGESLDHRPSIWSSASNQQLMKFHDFPGKTMVIITCYNMLPIGDR